MFDVGPSEFLLILVVAIVVIGPKDLPRVLYKVGQVIGKAKGMARHFRTGVDAMIREAELEDLQKQWAQDNARIMAETALPDLGGVMKPLADETAQLPAPEIGTSGTGSFETPAPGEFASAETLPPFQTDPTQINPGQTDPAQPALPLDTPQGDAPKGSSAA